MTRLGIVLALGVALGAAEQDAFLKAWNGIHGDAIAKHVEVLASDAYEGRAPGTPGEEKTIAYVTQAFKDAGLEPYLQDVPLIEAKIGGTPKLTMKMRGKSFAPGLLEDFVPRLTAPSAHVHLKKSPLVFAGYGCVAPEYGWDDYGDMDLTGKTVIILRGDPGTAKGDSSVFGAGASTKYGQGSAKSVEAAKRGAKAAISVFIESGAGVPWTIFKGGGLGQTQHFLAPDSSDKQEKDLGAVVLISEPQARALFAAAGLSLDEAVAAAGKRGFRAHALPGTADIDLDADAHAFDSHNVIGVIEGSGAPEESEVLMAHWDHMGVNPALPGDKIFNGAVDNASGVAALIEIARAYKAMPRAPRRSVVFVATTAEERGLLGAEYLARHPVKPLAKTAAAIAIDALFPFGPYSRMSMTGFGFTDLEVPLAEAASRLGRTIQDDGDPKAGAFFRADNYPWAKRGVPGLLSVGGPPNSASPDSNDAMKGIVEYVQQHYHRPSDHYDPKTWRVDGIEGDTRILFEFTWKVADDTRMPNWTWNAPYRALGDARLGRGSAVQP
jgi:Zn-dependent M28 family amino/carboxypeptidase